MKLFNLFADRILRKNDTELSDGNECVLLENIDKIVEDISSDDNLLVSYSTGAEVIRIYHTVDISAIEIILGTSIYKNLVAVLCRSTEQFKTSNTLPIDIGTTKLALKQLQFFKNELRERLMKEYSCKSLSYEIVLKVQFIGEFVLVDDGYTIMETS